MPTALFGGCTAGISTVGVARKLFGQKYLTRKINFVAKKMEKFLVSGGLSARSSLVFGPFSILSAALVRWTSDGDV